MKEKPPGKWFPTDVLGNPMEEYAPGKWRSLVAAYSANSAPSAEPAEVVISAPDYHEEGMGCGLEDRGITDRYEAMRYGWDCAIERMFEQIPEGPLYTAPPANSAKVLVEALRNLLADTQHSEHECDDSSCPVKAAREALASYESGKERGRG